jgi:hypothetical protein
MRLPSWPYGQLSKFKCSEFLIALMTRLSISASTMVEVIDNLKNILFLLMSVLVMLSRSRPICQVSRLFLTIRNQGDRPLAEPDRVENGRRRRTHRVEGSAPVTLKKLVGVS